MVEAIIFNIYNTFMIKRIYIEITNQCNLKCSFCKHNIRETKYMTIEEFKHILDEIEHVCKFIYLHVQGEPLLHPNLKEFIDIAYSRDFKIHITTNGSLISKNTFLVDKVRKISFSLHSIPYQNINPIDYINDILDFIDKCNDTYCELRFYNENSMDLKSKTILNYLENNYSFKVTNKNKSYKIKEKVFVAFDNLFLWPSLNNPFVSDYGFCYGGLEMISILSNGNISACCLDSDGDINIGNIYNSKLSEILQSEKFLNIVNGFKNKKAIEQLCKHCTYRLRFNR